MYKKEINLKNTMDSTEIKLLTQIADEFKLTCKFFFSREDYCIYFIFEDVLYGYSVIGGLDIGDIKCIWQEPNTEFSIEINAKTKKEQLTKQQTKTYRLLDYSDLINLYSRLNSSRHLNNNKNNTEL